MNVLEIKKLKFHNFSFSEFSSFRVFLWDEEELTLLIICKPESFNASISWLQNNPMNSKQTPTNSKCYFVVIKFDLNACLLFTN